VLPAQQREGKVIFSANPSLQIQLKRAAGLKAISEKVYGAVVALRLVRQDFAAAITALSSLSVSPARKPRIRRND
jgi:hypothetical protein